MNGTLAGPLSWVEMAFAVIGVGVALFAALSWAAEKLDRSEKKNAIPSHWM
jgi:hypothetical protein